ncbi:hypothetical protein KY358_04720, partial [Candidatus Woesearchaeota archaeon]|nr:hypothetical protein [Candidatus Woesearchaeota archaeon]
DAGHYNYTCNTTGSQNYTSDSASELLRVVLKNTSSCSLSFDPVSGSSYPSQVNASCTCTSNETLPQLYRNGSNVTGEISRLTGLAAGHYLYACNISETSSYVSAANTSIYILEKGASSINLTLNNTDSSITLEKGSYVNISAELIVPLEGNILLYQEGSLINNGTTRAYNYTRFDDTGLFNISAQYPETQNYTGSEEAHFLDVQDNTPPSISNISSEPELPFTNNGSSQNISVSFASGEYPINLTFSLFNSSGSRVHAQGPEQVIGASGLPIRFTMPKGLADGNYTLNMTASDPSQNNETHLIGIILVSVPAPAIISYSVFPLALINGSAVNLYISASAFEAVWANITSPDGTAQKLILTEGQNTTFAGTSQPGRYNITFYANNTQDDLASLEDYFESFTPLSLNITVTNSSISGINSSFEARYRGQLILLNSSLDGTFIPSLADALFELKFKAFSNRLHATFAGVNISSCSGASFGMDSHSSISGYLITYGVNTTCNFTNATIRVYYDNLVFSRESGLKLEKCSLYDFTARVCTGGWQDITQDALHNTTGDYFETTSASLSGFSIRQAAAAAPAAVGVDAASSVSGFAGKIGLCIGEWDCSPWTPSPCPSSGIQARSCINTNNCLRDKPPESRICTPPMPLLPLFDLSVDPFEPELKPGEDLLALVSLTNFGVPGPVEVALGYSIIGPEGNVVMAEHEAREVEVQLQFFRQFKLPEGLTPGEYSISAVLTYGNQQATSQDTFRIVQVKPESFISSLLEKIPCFLLWLMIMVLVIRLSYILWSRKRIGKDSIKSPGWAYAIFFTMVLIILFMYLCRASSELWNIIFLASAGLLFFCFAIYIFYKGFKKD